MEDDHYLMMEWHIYMLLNGMVALFDNGMVIYVLLNGMVLLFVNGMVIYMLLNGMVAL